MIGAVILLLIPVGGSALAGMVVLAVRHIDARSHRHLAKWCNR